MKKYLLLLALVCLLGNMALAQTKSAAYTTITHEVIDFTGFNLSWEGSQINWGTGDFSNYIESFSQNGLKKTYTSSIDGQYRISVSDRQNGGWNIGHERDHEDASYLQKASNDDRSVFVHGLHVGDIVKFTLAGNCTIESDNTATPDNNDPKSKVYTRNPVGSTLTEGQVLRIVNDHNDNGSTLEVKLHGSSNNNQYPGILKIEIDAVETAPHYDYDPGFEVYDMYDTGSGTTYNTNNDPKKAGFTLKGQGAYYLELTNGHLSLNNRLAISPLAGWSFSKTGANNNNGSSGHGLRAPGTNEWYNFSICNLKAGDRVQIFFSGDAPTFSSNGQNGGYTGSAAFKDTWNDGVLDANEGDHEISNGDPVEFYYCRQEGTFSNENEENTEVWLYSSYPYVITENGHLDLALKSSATTRIVKIKIFSDHQATMVDDYKDSHYEAFFDITGELKAKEHVVPGGLEVQVGGKDVSQNAIVVASEVGPVSFVKGEGSYKIPGLTKGSNGVSFEFNLANNIPTTGTFYKFIPLVNGEMTVQFTGASLNYYRYDLDGDAILYNNDLQNGGWTTEFDRTNEWSLERKCPYYLKVVDSNNNVSNAANFITVGNGKPGSFTINVEAGKTYYLYGGWSGDDPQNHYQMNPLDPMHVSSDVAACGVAELYKILFKPNRRIYPLAKWVEEDTKFHNDLADVVGYTNQELTVKKMSGNIIGCTPEIKEVDGKLKLTIKDITFKEGENPGGVVLIKFGTYNHSTGKVIYTKDDPVYAFTVSYDANYKSNSTTEAERGHTWDFSSKSLNGLEWNLNNGVPSPNDEGYYTNVADNISSSKFAKKKDFGTYYKNYFNNNLAETGAGHLLWDEMHYTVNGVNRSDWMFNYRDKQGDKIFDPFFSNKYDMEGDNADMMWDTEGIIIETSAHESVMFNEYINSNDTDGKNTVNHSQETDPDRYVGILPGGKFRIPWLDENDRVIIYMGSGTGTGSEQMVFNITNARDALYKEINPNDKYVAGGSQWIDEGGSNNNYRGCYHFFAKEKGDMIFELLKDGSSMCKLYKIQIYHGDRIYTNDIKGATADDKFLLWSRAKDPNDANDTDYTEGNRPNWTLQYFGKDQQLANGTNNVVNEIIAKTGNVTKPKPNSSVKTITTNAAAKTFTYTHELGEIGTFRMRGKDMEKNMKYVADYGDHNVTVAYQETMKYPYTWDFKDATLFNSGNEGIFQKEDGIGDGQPADVSDEFWAAFGGSITSKTYERTSRDLSLWETYENGSYRLRLNSQLGVNKAKDNIFETAKSIDGNQVWANGAVVPETQGVWFYTENNNSTSGYWITSDDGMDLNTSSSTWLYNVVIPNVPAKAAVYLRMRNVIKKDDAHFAYNLKGANQNEVEVYSLAEVPGTEVVDENDIIYQDYIFAVMNKGTAKRHLVLSFGGYQLKKLAVSEDPKTVNIKGYASESRNRVIDHELTSYFTDKPIHAYLAKQKDESTIMFEKITKPMPAATADGQFVGSVIYNEDNANDTGMFDVFGANSGFHLFVPDMHDYTGDPNYPLGNPNITDENADNGAMSKHTRDLQPTSDNMMQSFNAGGTANKKLEQTATKDIYVLSYKYLDHDRTGQDTHEAQKEAFYRLASSGAMAKPNSAYIQLGKPAASQAKVSFIFEDELFGETNNGIATGISEATDQGTRKMEWYSLDGQKLNGVPTAKGLYIVNGKKVLVK